MKRLFLGLLLTSILAPAHAETIVGVVNINKVLDSVQEGKNNKTKILSFIKDKRAVLKTSEAKEKRLQEKVDKQTIQDSIGDTSQRELKELSQEIQERSIGMQNDLKKFETHLMNPLKERVNSVIKEVSLKNGVDVTVDSSTSNFVYIARKKELTNEVIIAYDKKYPVKAH